MKKPRPIHPLLFSLFPILSLFAHNAHELTLRDLLVPVPTVLFCAAALWLCTGLIFRSTQKSAVAVSACAIVFFSYGHIHDVIYRWPFVQHINGEYFFAAAGLLLFAIGFILYRTRRDLGPLTRALNAVSAAMVLVCLLQFSCYAFRSFSTPRRPQPLLDVAAATPPASPDAPLRDIYHIVVDRYGSNDVIRDLFGTDNSAFTGYLRSKGFYVASQSSANYMTTSLSLSATLNLEYLDRLVGQMPKDSKDVSPLREMMQNYAVWRFLRSRGYYFRHVGPGYQLTRRNNYADENINYAPLREFSMMLYRTTLAFYIGKKLKLKLNDDDYVKWARVMNQFERMPKPAGMARPAYTFCHTLILHNPFVFDRHGNFFHREETASRGKRGNYIEHLYLTNAKLKTLIERLLSNTKLAPIIILQADEGPYPERYEADQGGFNWRHATRRELRQKMGVLNAFYLPGVDARQVLYPSISLVNTYRAIFKLYFGSRLDLLPDRNYAFVQIPWTYNQFEITDIIRPSRAAPRGH